MDDISIKCLTVNQPIGEFLIGVISWQDLLAISYSDIRRIQKEELGSIESYLGIQRELSPKRLKEISQYVSLDDATFPSSIVLSIKSEYKIIIDDENQEIIPNIRGFDRENGILKLAKHEHVAQIIDGQHRVFGIKKYTDGNPLYNNQFNFDLIVTIYIDIDAESESMIFATINKAQTKVNKSLVYDLFDLAKTRSPQKTAHNIVKLLDERDESPWKGKVNRLGKADDPIMETITQATLAESILQYISPPGQEMLDRDMLRKGKKLYPLDGKDKQRRFFRNWFIEEKDAHIAKLLWNYFTAIKNKWPEAWEQNNILVKSTGVIAFMKFLHPVVNQLGVERIIAIEEFEDVLKKITIKDDEFNKKNFIPGQTGVSNLLKRLKDESGLK